MAKTPKGWYPSTAKPTAPKVSASLKEEILQKATQFVETEFKSKYIQAPPKPDEFQRNYIVDIFVNGIGTIFTFAQNTASLEKMRLCLFLNSNLCA